MEPVLTGSDTSSLPPGRIALGIEYNGSCFSGWQAQKSPKLTTVQETLEAVLSEVADHPVSLICAGRTDTGVHATGQVVHFDCANSRPEGAWLRGANSLLPASVAIRWSRQVDQDFHARFSATGRRYRYVIGNNTLRPGLFSGLLTHHHYALDAGRMHEAGQALLGENDFSAYRGAACQSATPMRNVRELTVSRQGDFVLLDIEANAFLLHMVRNIAGVLMEIGEGRRPVSWAAEVLASRDRTLGGITAVPDGLFLVGVSYPQRFGLPQGPVYPVFPG